MSVGTAPLQVTPATQLDGRLELPSDKSIAHRALIVNALSGGPAVVEVRSPGRDVLSTASCLRELGVRVEESRGGAITRFAISGVPSRDATIDCGNSGTTMRLLAGVLAAQRFHARLIGGESLSRRPMERVARPLRCFGTRGLLRQAGFAPGKGSSGGPTARPPTTGWARASTAVPPGRGIR